MGARTELGDIGARLVDDQGHRLVPRGRDEAAVLLHQGRGEAVCAGVRFPGVETLGSQAPMVDAVVGPPSYSDDPTVRGTDLDTAAERAEHADRADPVVRLG